MSNRIPRDLQDKFIEAAALFVAKTGASVQDVQEFMVQILKLHVECLNREKREQVIH